MKRIEFIKSVSGLAITPGVLGALTVSASPKKQSISIDIPLNKLPDDANIYHSTIDLKKNRRNYIRKKHQNQWVVDIFFKTKIKNVYCKIEKKIRVRVDENFKIVEWILEFYKNELEVTSWFMANSYPNKIISTYLNKKFFNNDVTINSNEMFYYK